MKSVAIVALWAVWMHHLTEEALAGEPPARVLGSYLVASLLTCAALWLEFREDGAASRPAHPGPGRGR